MYIMYIQHIRMERAGWSPAYELKKFESDSNRTKIKAMKGGISCFVTQNKKF